MNSRIHLLAAFVAALIAAVWLPVPRLSAQGLAELPCEISPDGNSNDPMELVISYGNGSETRLPSHRGVVDPISLRIDQLMPLSLQFSNDKRGLPVAFSSLDGGGEIIPMASVENIAVTANGIFTFDYQPAGELFVDGDGIVRFAFQSGHEPGFHRVVVQLPGEQHMLQIFVTDPSSAVPPVWHH